MQLLQNFFSKGMEVGFIAISLTGWGLCYYYSLYLIPRLKKELDQVDEQLTFAQDKIDLANRVILNLYKQLEDEKKKVAKQ